MTMANLNNNGLKFHLNRQPLKDYSSLFYARKIERENTLIYEKLIRIYTRRPQLALVDKRQDIFRDKFDKANKIRREKKRSEFDALNLLNMKQVMPTKNLSRKECLNNWNKIIYFKKRRQLAKKARFSNIYI
jgi:hypothetical protein